MLRRAPSAAGMCGSLRPLRSLRSSSKFLSIWAFRAIHHAHISRVHRRLLTAADLTPLVSSPPRSISISLHLTPIDTQSTGQPHFTKTTQIFSGLCLFYDKEPNSLHQPRSLATILPSSWSLTHSAILLKFCKYMLCASCARGLSGRKVLPEAQILAIAEDLDEFVSVREGRARKSPKQAIDELMKSEAAPPTWASV